MNATLNPYLAFNGTTAEAMKFYQSVLGGELTMQTFGQTGMDVPDADKNKIVHAALDNGTLTFFASDGDATHPVHMGDNIKMSISGPDSAPLTKCFNGLAQGGTVEMPLAKQFWGDTFGQLTDKFGVHWMVNIDSGQHG